MTCLGELRPDLTFIEKPLLSACEWLHKHPDVYITQRRALYKYCKQACEAGEVPVIYKRKVFNPQPLNPLFLAIRILMWMLLPLTPLLYWDWQKSIWKIH